MSLIPRTLALIGLVCVGLPACSEGGGGGAPGGGNSGGAGGSGGTTGGGGSGGSQKPECADPGSVSGPTPEPRADSAGALSADGSTFLVFGGDVATIVCGTSPQREHVGETWLLDTACGGWKQIETAVAPSLRARHSIALDAASGRAILFGGRYRMGDSGNYTNYDDVWAFDFATSAWTEIATTGTAPSARSNAATAIVGGKLVVYGGNSSKSGLTFTPQGDVFVLDLATNVWSEVQPAGAAPEARLFHGLAGHPTKNVVYLHSGGDANAFTGPFLRDTWALDLDAPAWTKLADKAVDGSGRIKLGMWATVPDGAAEATLFVFGGHDDGQLGNRNDVLAAKLGATVAFENVRPGDTFNKAGSGACDFPVDFATYDPDSPERRSAFAVGALPDGSAAVIFGGDSDCGRLSDASWYDTRTNTWTPIRATLPGLVCVRTGSTTCTSLCN